MKKLLIDILNLLPKCHGQGGIACSNVACHIDDEGGKWCDEHAKNVYEMVNEDFGCSELEGVEVIRKAIEATTKE